ncbi:hypothetical protein GSI_12605 [Ganoderma sinense ZZ0214-1]|uniref:Uncharacterized protein n=1 Tax=Ganoderma sinense ZZ0214-1 TaxID=1077348 RepID=A0A2G8RT86_9APHY|nr:hypothetical protein GSI_12605 [Ganoderma sinense ZZ0214-1]
MRGNGRCKAVCEGCRRLAGELEVMSRARHADVGALHPLGHSKQWQLRALCCGHGVSGFTGRGARARHIPRILLIYLIAVAVLVLGGHVRRRGVEPLEQLPRLVLAGQAELDVQVQPARTQQRRVEGSVVVRCRKQDPSLLRRDPVQRVQ